MTDVYAIEKAIDSQSRFFERCFLVCKMAVGSSRHPYLITSTIYLLHFSLHSFSEVFGTNNSLFFKKSINSSDSLQSVLSDLRKSTNSLMSGLPFQTIPLCLDVGNIMKNSMLAKTFDSCDVTPFIITSEIPFANAALSILAILDKNCDLVVMSRMFFFE